MFEPSLATGPPAGSVVVRTSRCSVSRVRDAGTAGSVDEAADVIAMTEAISRDVEAHGELRADHKNCPSCSAPSAATPAASSSMRVLLFSLVWCVPRYVQGLERLRSRG